MVCTSLSNDWSSGLIILLAWSPMLLMIAWWMYQDSKAMSFYDLDLMSKYNITFPQLKQLRKEGKLRVWY